MKFGLIRNPSELQKLKSKLPSIIIFSDSESGPGTAMQLGPRFPAPGAYGALRDTKLVNKVGNYFGRSYHFLGVDSVMAPVADLSPLCPIVGWRSYGDILEIAEPALTNMIQGMATGGVIPIIKHYPGHGATRTDSHTTESKIISDWATFRDNDLELFKHLARLPQVGGIMAGFISAPQSTGGWPEGANDLTIVSEFWMTTLRKDWAYKGLIISDALNMGGMKQFKNPEVYCSSRFFMLGGDLIVGTPSENLLAQLAKYPALQKKDLSAIKRLEESVKKNRSKGKVDREKLIREGEALCQEVAGKALVSLGEWPSFDKQKPLSCIGIGTDEDKKFFSQASALLGLELFDDSVTSVPIMSIAIVKGSGLKLNALTPQHIQQLKSLHESGHLAGCIVAGNPLNAILLEEEGIPSLVCWGPSDCSLDAARRWLACEIKAEGRWPYPQARKELRTYSVEFRR